MNRILVVVAGNVVRCGAFVLLLLAVATSAMAQGNTGTISGTVVDGHGGFAYAVAGEMLAQGFRPDEIGKILGGNYARVFDRVTRRA